MISVIATVLNEGDNIQRLLDSLCAQTRPPDEVIIVDGGSADNTLAILYSYCRKLPLRVLSFPGCSISAGRNCAIEAACGDIIAATDAGLSLSPEWLEALEAPLLADPQLQIVGGFFQPDAHSTFELAMGAAVSRLVEEIHVETFLPGSRSIAFRKLAWLSVGGYPEWLDFGEDMLFILKLRRRYKQLAFAPQAVVYFRPRSSLRAFFRQYFNYATGDGKADLWRKRHAIRYATYLMGLPALLIGGLLHRELWMLIALAGGAYLYYPYRRLYRVHPQFDGTLLKAALLLPIIRATGDIAKMIGYPVGIKQRSEAK
jgi:glycosyltransferase involved in cell wall biosynthesis